MLKNLYNKTVTLQRLADVAGTKKEAWQTVTSGTPAVAVSVSCSIHPVEGSQQEMLEGGLFNTFKMFCGSAVDIRVGDRVIDGSDTYTVKGKKVYDFAGSSTLKHINLTIVKQV